MISTIFSRHIFEKTYHDAMVLLLKSESYFEDYNASVDIVDRPLQTARVDCEMTRITARLTRVIAWLLAQKAVYDGALSFQDAKATDYQIVRDPFCLRDSVHGQERILPSTVKDLLNESLNLYRRALVLCENNFSISSDQKPESEC